MFFLTIWGKVPPPFYKKSPREKKHQKIFLISAKGLYWHTKNSKMPLINASMGVTASENKIIECVPVYYRL